MVSVWPSRNHNTQWNPSLPACGKLGGPNLALPLRCQIGDWDVPLCDPYLAKYTNIGLVSRKSWQSLTSAIWPRALGTEGGDCAWTPDGVRHCAKAENMFGGGRHTVTWNAASQTSQEPAVNIFQTGLLPPATAVHGQHFLTSYAPVLAHIHADNLATCPCVRPTFQPTHACALDRFGSSVAYCGAFEDQAVRVHARHQSDTERCRDVTEQRKGRNFMWVAGAYSGVREKSPLTLR